MDAIDDHEFTGSLISLMQESVAFVVNNMKKKWRKTATVRIEYPDYPERAVQECIVNALIHRDYLEIGSEVHVDMFDGRLVISSPGGMPDGSLVQNLDLENVVSKRRNPVIADMFGRLDFMERRGSGFRKILEDYRFEENFNESKTPVFRSDPYSFSVTLYNLNYGANGGNTGGETSEEVREKFGESSVKVRDNHVSEANNTQNRILDYLASNPNLTATDLSIKTGLSIRAIEKNIKKLKDLRIEFPTNLLKREASTIVSFSCSCRILQAQGSKRTPAAVRPPHTRNLRGKDSEQSRCLRPFRPQHGSPGLGPVIQ